MASRGGDLPASDLKNGDRQHRPRADGAGSIGSVRHPAWDGEASPHFSTGGRGRFNRRAGGLGTLNSNGGGARR